MESESAAPKKSGKFGPGNPGKPKGAVNKAGKAAKEAIAEAAERLGGVERLAEWATESPLNERVFWGTIYPKLLPLQVDSKVAVSGGLVLIPAKNGG